MIRIFDVKNDEWFESIKFASEYYNIPARKIKDIVDTGKAIIGNKEYEFNSTGIKPDPFIDFVRKHRLKKVIGYFYLSPSGKVWLWASKKKQWLEWSVYTFDNGDRAFKATMNDRGRRYSKWINVDQHYKKLFSN